ncbi:DUF4956 domain-containing protein [bacterium]|nr:DUF4956 domain-containing protein [bacterium]
MNGIQDLNNLIQFSLNPGQFIRNLLIALICGFLISRFYRWTSKPSNNAKTFVNSLITLTMITAVVIIVIGNNLARAFGLVGAMSIIRFRTAVKDVQDIVFIFFSLAIGMASGIGLLMISLVGTVTIGMVMLGIAHVQSYTHMKRNYLLQFSIPAQADNDAPYLKIFEKFCAKHHLINMKFSEYDDHFDLSFYIKLKNQNERDSFIVELSHIDGMKNVNLLFEEE